jgi:hypothetical protein
VLQEIRSSAIGFCPLKNIYEQEGALKVIRERQQRLFEDGKMHEVMIVEKLISHHRDSEYYRKLKLALNWKDRFVYQPSMSLDFHGFHIICHPDVILSTDDKLILYEIKTTNRFNFSKIRKYGIINQQNIDDVLESRTLTGYLLQSFVYRKAILSLVPGTPLETHLYFRNVETPRDRYYEEYDIVVHNELHFLLEDLLKEALEKHAALDTSEVEPWECKGCPFNDICGQRKDTIAEVIPHPANNNFRSKTVILAEKMKAFQVRWGDVLDEIKVDEEEIDSLKKEISAEILENPTLAEEVTKELIVHLSKRENVDKETLKAEYPEIAKKVILSKEYVTISLNKNPSGGISPTAGKGKQAGKKEK